MRTDQRRREAGREHGREACGVRRIVMREAVWRAGVTYGGRRACWGVLLIAIAGIVVARPVVAQGARAERHVVTDSIRVTWNEYGRRMNAGDFGGALALYADDPRFIWVDRGAIVANSRATPETGVTAAA